MCETKFLDITSAKRGWKMYYVSNILAERSEAKKKYPKMLNFGASKPRVRGGPRAPGAPPLDLSILYIYYRR